MKTTKVGEPLVRLLVAAYRSNRPVLLVGPSGIGKSQIIASVAKTLNIGYEVYDLSIMEPTDIAGLPHIENGQLHYAPPKRLPTDPDSKGIVMLEEINRVGKDMQTVCLQLCTARKANDYNLPKGWLPMAAMNPFGDEYDVEELDPALMSRFMVLHVVADVTEWCNWAKENCVHQICIQYAKKNLIAIQDGSLSPRTLEYMSTFIQESCADDETLLAGLCGLSEKHGSKIFGMIKSAHVNISVPKMLKNPGPIIEDVKKWIARNRTDLLDKISAELLKYLKDKALPKNGSKKKHFDIILNALPKDKQVEIRRFAAEC